MLQRRKAELSLLRDASSDFSPACTVAAACCDAGEAVKAGSMYTRSRIEYDDCPCCSAAKPSCPCSETRARTLAQLAQWQQPAATLEKLSRPAPCTLDRASNTVLVHVAAPQSRAVLAPRRELGL